MVQTQAQAPALPAEGSTNYSSVPNFMYHTLLDSSSDNNRNRGDSMSLITAVLNTEEGSLSDAWKVQKDGFATRCNDTEDRGE